MNAIIQTFLLAMTPVGELRVAIPTGIYIHYLTWQTAYIISVIGNLVPVVFLLLFLEPVSIFLSKHFKIFKKFFDWLFERTRKKSASKIKKYGYPTLVLFVAIPLPLTGAWTGSAIAFLFNIPFKIALPLISLGVLISGLLVVFVGYAWAYLGWPIALVVTGIIYLVYQSANKHKKKCLI